MENLLNSIPELKGWTSYEDISSGLINKIYKIKLKNNYKILRVLNQNAEDLGIDRSNEIYNFHIAQKTKVIPKLLGFNNKFNYIVTEFIPGKILHNKDLKNKATVLNIIDSMKQFHNSSSFVNEFNPFDMIYFYESWLQNRGYKFKNHSFKIKVIKKFLDRDPSKFVPCHNDIRAFGNIIETKNKIKFVDLEFTGNNDPCYEIGFFWSESKLSIDDLHLITYYYFGKDVEKNSAKAQLYAIVADYMWYLQGVIGDKIDYEEEMWKFYAKITYRNFKSKSSFINIIKLLKTQFFA
jgi:thiamine kinase-like enzyme